MSKEASARLDPNSNQQARLAAPHSKQCKAACAWELPCFTVLCAASRRPDPGQYSSELLTHAYSDLYHYCPQFHSTDQHELPQDTAVSQPQPFSLCAVCVAVA